jgi:hypothetical protein
MTKFRKGQKVYIINSTMGGTFIVEGQATIVRRILDVDSQYLVDFGDGFGPVERFVDPLAQDNPAEFVAHLNDPDEPEDNFAPGVLY